MARAQLTMVGEIEENLISQLIDYLHRFDDEHPNECHFDIEAVVAPQTTLEQMQQFTQTTMPTYTATVSFHLLQERLGALKELCPDPRAQKLLDLMIEDATPKKFN
jgi:hypothetical protein